MPLSDQAVKKAKPADKPYKLADEKGLYLLVNAAGRYWRMDYRHDGKRKTLAFGVYPDVSLARAREKRDEARTQLADGIDTQARRASIASWLIWPPVQTVLRPSPVNGTRASRRSGRR